MDVNGVVRVMPCGCGMATFYRICIWWWVEREGHAERHVVRDPRVLVLRPLSARWWQLCVLVR